MPAISFKSGPLKSKNIWNERQVYGKIMSLENWKPFLTGAEEGK
jgi:hypothetical protein